MKKLVDVCVVHNGEAGQELRLAIDQIQMACLTSKESGVINVCGPCREERMGECQVDTMAPIPDHPKSVAAQHGNGHDGAKTILLTSIEKPHGIQHQVWKDAIAIIDAMRRSPELGNGASMKDLTFQSGLSTLTSAQVRNRLQALIDAKLVKSIGNTNRVRHHAVPRMKRMLTDLHIG